MYRAIVLVGVGIGIAAMGSAAMAASASEMLEKGIYTEETVGDLDRAISIYEKVVAEGKAAHALAAQAQYHIGQCLLKKGKKAEATAAFQKLVSDFPDQKELVAKARKFLPQGLPLGPVPWVDGETLQLSMRFATGAPFGEVVYTARSAIENGKKTWRVGSQTVLGGGGIWGASWVEADWNTFRPISSAFRFSHIGTICAAYLPTQVIITAEGPVGKSVKKIDEKGTVYDNEQAMDVMRRLPLVPGYHTKLPVFATMSAGNLELPLDVPTKETISVAAGKFDCFKVHLGLVEQLFWFSADPHRYLVKISAAGFDAELASIGQIKPGEPRQYVDRKMGYSVTAPGDWFFFPIRGAVYLLDPRAVALDTLRAVKLADLKAEERASLRAWAEAGLVEPRKAKKDFKVRPDSWQDRKVSGLPALGFVADYIEGNRKMVEYYTLVLGKTIGWKFTVSVPQDQFDSYRKQFDAIVDSLKVK